MRKAYFTSNKKPSRHATFIAFVIFLNLTLPAVAENFPKPVTNADYAPVNLSEVALGRLLFWDPILSGNRNISCGTCHHPRFATSDGVALSIGEGGIGLGPDRRANPENVPEARIPRNAPALFNLGAREFNVLFHDGRIEVDTSRKSGFRTPLGSDMLVGFDSALSAQSMFPVLSADEMAGHYSENEVAQAARQGRLTGEDGVWHILALRVADIPEYRQMFDAAYSDIANGRAISFTDISNAIAAFIGFEWRSDLSDFDRFLRGQIELADASEDGADLFYGKARCGVCHSGKFQTDHDFHAMGLVQIGPGKSASFENYSGDKGRSRITGNDTELFAFRTPSLRNVTATGPYGHNGAYTDLEDFVRAHLDPIAALQTFDRQQVVFADFESDSDWRALDDPNEISAISSSVGFTPIQLKDEEIAAILAFLSALNDPNVMKGRMGIPQSVPSGLFVDR